MRIFDHYDISSCVGNVLVARDKNTIKNYGHYLDIDNFSTFRLFLFLVFNRKKQLGPFCFLRGMFHKLLYYKIGKKNSYYSQKFCLKVDKLNNLPNSNIVKIS